MVLSFNKWDCFLVLKNFGIKCVNFYYVNKGDIIVIEEILKIVGFFCFVKFSWVGFSFGVSKVYFFEEMILVIEKVFKEDFEIIIEIVLVGIEVFVGVYIEN